MFGQYNFHCPSARGVIISHFVSFQEEALLKDGNENGSHSPQHLKVRMEQTANGTRISTNSGGGAVTTTGSLV